MLQQGYEKTATRNSMLHYKHIAIMAHSIERTITTWFVKPEVYLIIWKHHTSHARGQTFLWGGGGVGG